jgi:DNA-binding LacI/PurR family transcriptional regulator
MVATGQAAVALLLDLLNGRAPASASPIVLPGELVIRSSTGPCRPLDEQVGSG